MRRLKHLAPNATVRPKNWALLRQIFSNYRERAFNKGVSFELDFLYFKELVQKDCFYCGAAPENEKKDRFGYRLFYQGLDRLINADGYTLENVVPCCAKCNAMKSDILTPRQMLAAVKAIKKLRK